MGLGEMACDPTEVGRREASIGAVSAGGKSACGASASSGPRSGTGSASCRERGSSVVGAKGVDRIAIRRLLAASSTCSDSALLFADMRMTITEWVTAPTTPPMASVNAKYMILSLSETCCSCSIARISVGYI